MHLLKVIWLGAVLALLAIPAYAARDDHRGDVDVRGRIAINLGDFNIVIGDMGDRFDGWDDRPTRVHVEVLDGGRTRDHYFDSLPAALFVLRQMYYEPRILRLDVPEYAGARQLHHGRDGNGLIDGSQATYLWDYDNYSRGGLPLVLAFSDSWDAQNELSYRNGELLDFSGLVWALDQWAQGDRDSIYWRGWDNNNWDNVSWNGAWDSRWDGWGWDGDRGWRNSHEDQRDLDRERNRHEHERQHRDQVNRDREQGRDQNGGRARERERGREQNGGQGESEQDRNRQERERQKREKQDRERDREPGSKQTQEK